MCVYIYKAITTLFFVIFLHVFYSFVRLLTVVSSGSLVFIER